MSVLKNKRSLSKYQVQITAQNLEIKIIQFLMKDFGVKPKALDYKYSNKIRSISIEDKAIIDEILEKYNLSHTIFGEYPLWAIEYFRRNILNLANLASLNIKAAAVLYPQTIKQFEERYDYINKAIINYNQLLHYFNILPKIFSIEIQKFQPYLKDITYEIALLQNWRKRTSQSIKQLKG